MKSFANYIKVKYYFENFFKLIQRLNVYMFQQQLIYMHYNSVDNRCICGGIIIIIINEIYNKKKIIWGLRKLQYTFLHVYPEIYFLQNIYITYIYIM